MNWAFLLCLRLYSELERELLLSRPQLCHTFLLCLQLYNEGCHDLYQRGAASQANLPVFEDEIEGYQVQHENAIYKNSRWFYISCRSW